MKLFEGIKIFGILLMVAMLISFFGCGEDEEELTEPNSLIPNPINTEVNSQINADPPGPPVEIVWIEIGEDGNRKEIKTGEKEEFHLSDQIKAQNVMVVKVIDADGAPVPDVKVEWTLNRRPDAVGDIVDTDDPGDNNIPAAPNLKINNQFAITYTNSETGIPSQLEGIRPGGTDITIEKGETWIVITSVDEGNTYITAFANEIPRKNTHKIFAVKHWTDCCLIPQESQTTCINRCEEPPDDANKEELVTKVASCRDENPKQGIKVRYTIEDDGPDAVWAENDKKIIDLESNENGEVSATIKLVSPLPEPSKECLQNTIKMEAFCEPEGEVSVATKIITKEWCSAFLTISMSCPEGRFNAEDPVPFGIKVTNDGKCDAKGVEVTLDFPSDYFNLTDPVPVGDLPPGASSEVDVTLKVKEAVIFSESGDLAVTAKAGSEECVESEPDKCTFSEGYCDLDLLCERTSAVRDDGETFDNIIEPSCEFKLALADEATITVVVENPESKPCDYYELKVEFLNSNIVEYTTGSANPKPDEEPDGTIIWRTAPIEGDSEGEFTFGVKAKEVSDCIDIIKVSLNEVETPEQCDIKAIVCGPPYALDLLCEEIRAVTDDGVEFTDIIEPSCDFELLFAHPEAGVATITIVVENLEPDCDATDYELKVTLLHPKAVGYMEKSAEPPPDEESIDNIIWRTPLIKSRLRAEAESEEPKAEFTFKVKANEFYSPCRNFINVSLNKVETPKQECNINIGIPPKWCSVESNGSRGIVREGEEIDLTAKFKNIGLRDGKFNLNSLEWDPNGLSIESIERNGATIGITDLPETPIGETVNVGAIFNPDTGKFDGDPIFEEIDILIDDAATFTITLTGKVWRETEYKVILHGEYWCEGLENQKISVTETISVRVMP